MKRIKTSNILIATALLLIILFFLFVFLVIHHYSKVVYSDTQKQEAVQYSNYQEVPHFSVIVLSADEKVKILKGEKYALKYSGTLAYTLSGDTLYPQSQMIIITPSVKTIIAKNQSVFDLQLSQDSLNLILGDDVVGKIEKSNFRNINIIASNSAFLKVTPETNLGNVHILLTDRAKASLLGEIDTLSGQTSNKTFIYTSHCKHISATIKGTHTQITGGKKNFGVYIEKESN